MRIIPVRDIIVISIDSFRFKEGLKMKRIIAVFMAIALILSISIVVFADDEVFEGGSYRYKIINDEEVSVVGFHGDGIDLHLDSSIGHRFITEVGPSAFEFNDNLVNVRLSSRVKAIGDYAFHGCTELQRITIPAAVQSVGRYAFQNCVDLETIALPEGITEIPAGTFMFCPALTSVSLPSTVEKIGSRAFDFCTSLESLTIPAAVSEIAEDAFKDCNRLTLCVADGSYAEQFAENAGIPYTVE